MPMFIIMPMTSIWKPLMTICLRSDVTSCDTPPSFTKGLYKKTMLRLQHQAPPSLAGACGGMLNSGVFALKYAGE